eukprot:s2366_g13.t1
MLPILPRCGNEPIGGVSKRALLGIGYLEILEVKRGRFNIGSGALRGFRIKEIKEGILLVLEKHLVWTLGEDKSNALWNLLPSFDPTTDSAKEYTDKVKFLWGICPGTQRAMLAPRLALLCKGTAWSQVKGIAPEKLTSPEDGVKNLLKALEVWQESEELQTYDQFEKAFYKVSQKGDESVVSFVNRLNVAFNEVGDETTVKQVKAFVLLRQSNLSSEDKRRVISMADGYDPHKVETAMRSLAAKVLGSGEGSKTKIYPVNFADDEPDEIYYTTEEEMDDDQVLSLLLEEGDESALLVSEFEDQVIQVCQDSPELSMAFSAYQEARAKLRDKARSRGFWPLRPSSKGKGKGKKGKPFGKRRQSLAERIASSNCRHCGARGHWKDECPARNKSSSTADANVMIDEMADAGAGELVYELPDGTIAQWQVGLGQKDDHFHSLNELPNQFCVNEEFSQSVSPEYVLHVSAMTDISQRKSKSKSRFHSPNIYQVLRSALETGFSVSRSLKTECEGGDLGPDGTGIIDTGASKSVIGEKRVDSLLNSLSANHKSQVKWHPSETVFRFGNNGVLRSVGALFIPFGDMWMKIEVVKGSTPFLISNAFLHALHADLLVSQIKVREVSAKQHCSSILLLRHPLMPQLRMMQLKWLNQRHLPVQCLTRSVKDLLCVLAMASLPKMVQGTDMASIRRHVTEMDIPLTGPVDPAMEVAVGSQEPEVKHPPGIKTLRQWGQIKFPEGKWKGHLFSEVYHLDVK